jgi:hypothetical protein
MFGRLLRLGMPSGSVRTALLGGMRRSRFGCMRVMFRDGWMGDVGCGHSAHQTQRDASREKLPEHVIELSQATIFSQTMFGKDRPRL